MRAGIAGQQCAGVGWQSSFATMASVLSAARRARGPTPKSQRLIPMNELGCCNSLYHHKLATFFKVLKDHSHFQACAHFVLHTCCSTLCSHLSDDLPLCVYVCVARCLSSWSSLWLVSKLALRRIQLTPTGPCRVCWSALPWCVVVGAGPDWLTLFALLLVF